MDETFVLNHMPATKISVLDRHRFDVDPDPDPLSILMSIQIRIWILLSSQVLYMLENLKKNLTFIHTSARIHSLIFLGSVIGVIIFNILDKK
jgi:hypothetical protein